MGKHAYLIMAYNHVDLLNQLLGVLDDPRNEIFLHIDATTPDSYMQAIRQDLKFSAIHYSPRVNVNWGGFSQIRAELSVLGTAVATGHYDYYHLISGADLPIKTQDELHAFFDANQGKEFIQFQQPTISAEKLSRVKTNFYFQEKDVRHNKFYAMLQRVLTKLQRMVGVDRIKNTALEFQMGSNWFSVTDDLARTIMAQADKLIPYFRHTQCADELFVQTIVVNSEYKQRLYHAAFDDSKLGNMRFIEWVNHAPRDLIAEDFDALKNSPLLFARKFNPDTDNQIVKQVLSTLAR